MDYPEYLYHYTSIETLALIVSKRCIRFNCLKFVDDPEENVSSDIKQSGKLCLVSCWTDMVEDSLPMWNMYTPKMRGVKLKMKSYPFKEYPATMKNAWNLLDSDGNIVEESGMISYLGDYTSYIDEQKIMKENKAFVVPPSPELIAVKYTNDEKLLKPKIISNGGFNIDRIGRFKRNCWKFQSEWRYIILFTSFSFKDIKIQKKAKELYSVKDIPYKNYDLELADNAFEGMEITLGPKTSEAEEIIVNAIVEKYRGEHTIKIKRSNLHIQ